MSEDDRGYLHVEAHIDQVRQGLVDVFLSDDPEVSDALSVLMTEWSKGRTLKDRFAFYGIAAIGREIAASAEGGDA